MMDEDTIFIRNQFLSQLAELSPRDIEQLVTRLGDLHAKWIYDQELEVLRARAFKTEASARNQEAILVSGRKAQEVLKTLRRFVATLYVEHDVTGSKFDLFAKK